MVRTNNSILTTDYCIHSQMSHISDNMIFIFFTGCLFMAMLYHIVLSAIQRNNLLLHYSAYLFAATLFLAERVLLEFASADNGGLQANYWYNLLDEPIQMLIYLTYLNFAARALDIFNTTDKRFITFYYTVICIIIAYTVLYFAGFAFNRFSSRPAVAFIIIRVILMSSLVYLLIAVSKYIRGYFFKFIIAGSLMMFIGNLFAFITSITLHNILGMFGVMWTCIALMLDVTCFSAALGYKARKDLLDKQSALKQLIAKEKQLQQQELEKINAIYLARDTERNRIARDLHDEIGSTLSSIHIYSSIAEKTMQSNPEKTKQVLNQINSNTRAVMENMSDIVWAMKTGDQQDILLSNKIKNIGYELLTAKNINCRYEIDDASDHADLDIDLRRNILLIVKESINNTVKYSNATDAKISIAINNNALIVCVTDNGNGFDRETAHKGNGLQNINFRVKQCGGKLQINSDAGKGTAINCSFPLTSISDK